MHHSPSFHWLMLLAFPLLLIAYPPSLAAQALHIHYNLETGVPIYISGKDTLEQARVKHGSEVFFHLENLNIFRFSADVEKSEDPLSTNSGGGSPLSMISGLFPSGGLPGMEFLGSSTTNSGVGQAFDHIIETDLPTGFVSTQHAAKVETIQDDFKTTLSSMLKTEDKILRLNKNIKESINRRASVVMAKQEIKRLKAHTGLKASQILKISNEFINKALGSKAEDFDMLSFAEKEASELKGSLETLASAQKNYATDIEHLGEIQEKITSLDIPTNTALIADISISLAKVREKAGNMNQNLIERQLQYQKAAGNNLASFTKDLIDLRYEMELLQPENFRYTERFEVNAGSFSLQPTFFPIDSIGNRTNGKTTTLAPIRVKVRGGLRISSSVGISLAKYFDAPREYAVKDGIIISNEIDRFSPIANTLLHFHPYGAGRLVVGGAFGVGIPLGSNEGGKSTTFLLGPSLILGDRDKVFITGGIVGGQVNRLGGGLKEGDNFTFTDGTLETRSRYELGYFFSLSFKLFGK